MKIEKVILYGIILKILTYLILIIMVITFLVFDILVMSITGIFFFVLYAIVYDKRTKLLREEKEDLQNSLNTLKIQLQEKKKGFPSLNVNTILNYLKETLNEKPFNIENPERYIEAILKSSKGFEEKVISYIKKSFISKLIETLEILLYFIDKEEYELHKFLTVKRRNRYTFWTAFEIVIVIGAIIFVLLAYLFYGELSIIFILVFFILVIFFRDVNSLINQTFSMGYYRYVQNKKMLQNYQELLNLMCNNTYIRNSESFKEADQILNVFNSKCNVYKAIITPYYYYLKNFEIFTILGIIIPFIIIIFQDLFLNIPILMIEMIFPKILSLISAFYLIFSFIYDPIRKNRKKVKQNVGYDDLKKKLDENIKVLNLYHYAFIHYNSDIKNNQV